MIARQYHLDGKDEKLIRLIHELAAMIPNDGFVVVRDASGGKNEARLGFQRSTSTIDFDQRPKGLYRSGDQFFVKSKPIKSDGFNSNYNDNQVSQ